MSSRHRAKFLRSWYLPALFLFALLGFHYLVTPIMELNHVPNTVEFSDVDRESRKAITMREGSLDESDHGVEYAFTLTTGPKTPNSLFSSRC
ncbi:MAG: hypothetical protein IJV53_00370 [Aeriscardovia sp.]|nr:hypothetical protein [Aeriscardovia sp.]